MPLDPQAEQVLQLRASSGSPSVESVPPEVARANFEATPREQGPEVAKTEDRRLPTPYGEVPVRLYWPDGAGPFPALIWLHGGGWLVGSLNSTDAACRHLTNLAGISVVSVDYSLSPDAKFPQALEECYAIACWLAEHGSDVRVHPARIAVGGGSAGGNLAAAVALKARDEGGPVLVMQLLVYPVLSFDGNTESYALFGEGYGLNASSLAYYTRCYLRSEADARHPYAAPLHAPDLSGLPPAHIMTAEYDPLRDEGEAYARRLQQAGVPTTCTRYDGMVHAFFNFPTRVEKTRQALQEAASALRKTLFT